MWGASGPTEYPEHSMTHNRSTAHTTIVATMDTWMYRRGHSMDGVHLLSTPSMLIES